MAQDPYGYESDAPPPASGKAGSDAVAGCSTLVWLGCATAWCGGCTGAMVWSPPKTATPGAEMLGVWLLLVAPAWPLAAIGLWTVGLHAVTRRWWTSAGPNVLAGATTGCLAWMLVFVAWVIVAVVVAG